MATSEDAPVRVLLADDDLLVRELVAGLLGASPGLQVVGRAADGVTALRAARELRPDVAVLDVHMPGLSGIEVTDRLLHGPAADGPAVLVLTGFDEEAALYAALRAGATGFLLKHTAPADLVSAIRALARGDAWLDPTITRRLLADFAPAGRRADPPAGWRALTDRERVVLALLAQGLSNTEIAERLFVGHGTVKTHVSHILLKLELRDRVQAVAYAWRHDLVAVDE